MNVFIDTCILYNDPFWKGNFSSQLLDLSQQGRVKIFISEVVLKELRHSVEKCLDKEIYDLKGSNSNLRRLLRGFESYNLPDKEECLSDFDNFYEEIRKNNKVEILKCKEEFLSRVLEMAINRKKPFTEKKTELKDALIWLTYSDYVNQYNLSDCFFLTENVTDFCNPEKFKDKVFELHPELLKECDKLKVFISIKDFYTTNSALIEKTGLSLQDWIKSDEFDDKYIFDLLFEHKDSEIFNEVTSCIEKLDPCKIFENGHLVTMGGYLGIGEIEWHECKNTDYLILDEDCILISGDLVISVGIEAYGYNSVVDTDEEKFPFVGDTTIEVDITFSFTFKEKGKPEFFEILDTEIK